MQNRDDDISRLIEKHSDRVLRIALTYLKNIADAQDVCQDVFIKLFKHNDKVFHDSEHEKAWIVRVTINTCKDALNSSWKKRFLPFNENLLPIKNKENREVVSWVLQLPEKYRIVLYLHYFENYSTLEIAELLNKKENTVRTQLKRAREKLKAKMTGGMDDEE
jgi:RNA polymerase sigma factor (sigma-70 family)